MTFLEILQHPITCLPIKQVDTASFRSTVKKLLNQFGTLVDESTDLSGPVNNSEFKPDIFKQRSKLIREGIIDAIDAYYDGDINLAYNNLSSFMKKANVANYMDKDFEIPEGNSFFRIRCSEGNYALSKPDLFHIPFQLRGKVATQRYSIPGLPSLYLSNSIFVAWEEMRRPGFNKIQAIRLQNQQALHLLDLTTDIYSRNDHLLGNENYGWQLLYKIMTWPLVCACSIKVKNPSDTFKPEYIIPQLLLQWVNKNKVDGIIYSSTHIDLNEFNHQGRFHNVVLPVKTSNLETGHCPQLVSMFKATQVLPMELRQFISKTDRFDGQESISTAVNKDIQYLALIKDNPQCYSSSYFGILEHSLNYLQLEPII